MTPLALMAPLILAGVLLVSGIAKLRRPDTADGWAELGVPQALRRRWLQTAHPWGELLLAALLAVAGGVLGALAGAAAVALFGVYLLLVVRARRQRPDAACNCFGARRRITAVTVARNAWLLALALVAVAVTWTTPLLGGPLAALGSMWIWLLALLAAGLTVWLSVGDGTEPEDASTARGAGAPAAASVSGAASASAQDDDGDYIRTRTPAVPVLTADGTTRNLRDLAMQRPLLLFAVSEGCGSCAQVIEAVPRWRELLPEVSGRFLLRGAPGQSSLTETTEPQSLHDEHQYVRGSIADWPTPTAVLIGVDGYLAGGPVSGYDDIADFIEVIDETLHGARPTEG